MSLQRFLPYAAAIGSTIGALLLSLLLNTAISHLHGTFFYIAIAVSAWYGGLRPGIVAIVLSALAILYFLIPPIHQIQIADYKEAAHLFLFVTVSLLITLLSVQLGASRQKLEQLSRQLLQESSSRLKVALNAAQMGMWDWNLATGEIHWSPEKEQLYGLAPGQFDGRYETFVSCIHPNDRERLSQSITQAIASRLPYQCEYRVQWADGSIHWIEGRGQAFYNEAGEAIQMSGTVMMIDDRKQVELTLEEREARLRLAQAASRSAVWDWNIQSNTVVWSSEYYQLFEIVPDTEASYENWLLSIHPDDRATVHQQTQEAVSEKASELRIEFRGIGTTAARWFAEIGQILYDAANQPVRMIGIAIDITQQKQAEIALQAFNADLECQVTERTAEFTAVADRLLSTYQEQAQIRKALRESEERSQLALDLTQTGLWDYHLPSGKIIWNGNHFTLLGLTPGCCEPTLELWASRVHPNDLEFARQQFFDALRDRNQFRAEYRVIHPDGAIRWVLARAQGVYDAAGQPVRSVGVLLDVTDRKLAEIALLESEARYRALAEISPVAIFRLNVDMNCVYVNDRWSYMTGRPKESALGQGWVEALHPDERDSYLTQWAEDLAHADPDDTTISPSEGRHLRPDGSINWYFVQRAPVKDAAGTVVSYVGTLTDITDRKLAEAALAQEELRRKALFDASIDGIFVLNQDGNIIEANASFARMLGYSQEEVVRLNLGDFDVSWTPKTTDHSSSTHLFCLNRFETRHRCKDGSIYDVEISSNSLIWDGQSVQLCICRDISDRKAAELALQQQADRERTLHSVVQAIRSSLELDNIFAISVTQIADFLQGGVSIVRYVPEEECWRTLMVCNQGKDFAETPDMDVPDANNPFAQRLKQLEIVKIDDTTLIADPINREIAQNFPGAWLLVPISVNGTIWGSLTLARPYQTLAWQPEDVDLARRVADQLAIAIQQAKLYGQVQQLNISLEQQVQARTADLHQVLEFETLLKRITDQVRDSLDEDQILETVVRELGQGLQLECCDTGIYSADLTVSTITHEFTQSFPAMKGTRFEIAEVNHQDIYPFLFQGQTIQFCDSAPASLRPHPRQFTILACPIVDDQRVLGDMWMYKQETFSSLEVRLVQQVANQCAIALRQSRLYQAAQTQVQELEQLNRLKDDFLSTVSHELRTPMSNIKMATQMLDIALSRLGIFADESNLVKRYFDVLREEGQREINLINDLLDLTRLDANTEPLNPTEIELQFYIPHVAEPFIERTHQQQQHLMIQIAEDLPPFTTHLPFLERILTELLHNACKYTFAGETITVSAQQAAQLLEIRVSNTGVVIAAEERDRIFERFYRIPNNDPWRHGGTGLGLALVKKLVERLEGTIRVESEAEQTVFVVELQSCLD